MLLSKCVVSREREEARMGGPDRLSPDVVEWVVADEKVARRWKDLARRLGLEAYVPAIDQNYSYRLEQVFFL